MKSSFNPGKLGSVFLTKQNQQSAFTQPLPKRPPAPSCPPCAGCQRPFSVVLQPKRNQTPGGTQGLSPPCCHPRGGFRAPHRVPWSRAGKRRARGREAAAVAWQPRRGRPRWRRRRGGGAAAGPGVGNGAPGVSGTRSRHRGTGPAPGSCPWQGWGAPSWVPGSPLGAPVASGAAGGGCPRSPWCGFVGLTALLLWFWGLCAFQFGLWGETPGPHEVHRPAWSPAGGGPQPVVGRCKNLPGGIAVGSTSREGWL